MHQLADKKELSLLDLIGVWRCNWPWIIASATVGLAISAIAMAILPQKYEAEMLIQVGQVGQVGQVRSALVELPSQAIERMRSGAFQLEAATLSGYAPWIEAAKKSADPSNGFCSFQLVKNTDLIRVMVTADSQDNAIKISEAIVATLSKRHNILAEATISRLKAGLKLAEAKLAAAENGLNNLMSALSEAKLKDDRFSQFALLTSIKQIKEQDFYAQRQIIMEINLALTKPSTQSANVIESVHSIVVTPDKRSIATIGVICGLLFGLLLSSCWHLWRVRKL